jgi:hypothetical protein
MSTKKPFRAFSTCSGYGENPKVPLPLVALASQKSGMVLRFL